MDDLKLKLAFDFACDLEPIKDIQCPRYVINPGRYFGFMRGWEAALKAVAAQNLDKDPQIVYNFKNEVNNE
jgi:hypothetical protein